jgi:hypothetical protein
MKPLMERCQGFAQKKPPPVKRGGPSYNATYEWARCRLEQYVMEYQNLIAEDQTARLIRDDMDHTLRRYQNYCIKENIGAHYYEQGLAHDDKTEFEHIIPASVARDMLLFDRFTINEVLNIPTCRLSKKKHELLNSTGLVSTTPDPYWFWQRYQSLGIKVDTHDGTEVDMATWNLGSHYQYFKVL